MSATGDNSIVLPASFANFVTFCILIVALVRLGYCFTPYQRLRLYNGAPFSRLLRHTGDTEDVFSA